jgi:hypothetical protein
MLVSTPLRQEQQQQQQQQEDPHPKKHAQAILSDAQEQLEQGGLRKFPFLDRNSNSDDHPLRRFHRPRLVA